MKFLTLIVSLLILISCTPAEIPQQEELPTPPAPEEPDEPDQPTTDLMKITIGSTTFTATLASTATVTAFKAMLPLTLGMNDFNSNEKVCSLPTNLPTEASNPGRIQAGDIMLYGSSSLVLFYETFSTAYSYTRIGRIDDVSSLRAAVGTGSITVKFEMQ